MNMVNYVSPGHQNNSTASNSSVSKFTLQYSERWDSEPARPASRARLPRPRPLPQTYLTSLIERMDYELNLLDKYEGSHTPMSVDPSDMPVEVDGRLCVVVLTLSDLARYPPAWVMEESGVSSMGHGGFRTLRHGSWRIPESHGGIRSVRHGS